MPEILPFKNSMTAQDQRRAFWRWANSYCHLKKVKLITILVILVSVWAHLQTELPLGIIPAINFLLIALTLGLIFYLRILFNSYRSALAPFKESAVDSEKCLPEQLGLKFQSERGQYTLPWSDIEKVEVYKDMILLFVKEILFCPLMLTDISKDTKTFILSRVPAIKTRYLDQDILNYSLLVKREQSQKESFSNTKKLAVIATVIAVPLLIASLRNSAEMSLAEKERIRSLSMELEKSPDNEDLLRTRSAIFFAYAGSKEVTQTPPVNFLKAEAGSIFEYYHPYYLERALADQERLIALGISGNKSGLIELSYIKGLGEQARRNHEVAIQDFSRILAIKKISDPRYLEALSKRTTSFLALGDLKNAEADLQKLKMYASKDYSQFIKESELNLAILKAETDSNSDREVMAQPKKTISSNPN